MTTFLRLLAEGDKGAALREVCSRQRAECRGQNAEGRGQNAVGERGDPRVFEVAPEAFDAVPGKPFAYWVSDVLRETFARLSAFESKGRTARRGPSTCDDFRYLRLWWEVDITKAHRHGEWRGFSKGGAFSRYYADIYLIVDWEPRRATFHAFPVRDTRLR